eukprot:GHVQ01017816.1.p1 GENE.GHVQ01017816.1~~GHVQ01017816.1.p1  ORF type:complete len:549 (-),score=83.33 GHVQ01017816.1:1872-3518(-)
MSIPDLVKASEQKEKGNQLFKSANFDEAVAAFTAAIEANPGDHVLYSNRSGAYASLHKYKEALQDAEKCVKLKPDWPKGYSRKGLALHNLGKSDEAETTYNQGLKIDPNNAALKDGLANIKETAKPDMEELQAMMAVIQAVQGNEKIKKYAEEDPDYIQKITGILKQLRTNPQSLATVLQDPDPRLREGLMAAMGVGSKGGPEDEPPPRPTVKKTKEPEKTTKEKEADEWKDKGNKLYKERKFEEALEMYDKAMEVNPDDIIYHNNKAAVYLEMTEYDKCLAECRKALDRRYDSKASFQKIAKVYSRMAACHLRQNDLDNAIEMYEKSLLEDNDRLTRVALKDAERLRDKRQKEAYLSPELAEQHREKGNEFFKAGDYPNAKKEYDEAQRRCPTDAKVYANRSAVLSKLGEFPSALKDCDKALEIDPAFVKCWIRKGNLHFIMRENHKAMPAFSQALKLDPENHEAREGKMKVIMKVQQTSQSTEVDEDQYRHAMADPEIQEILGDPQFQMILKKITENPSTLNDYMNDPKIAEGISKLISAGILRTG